jgi:hypothetical protein
VPSGIYTDLGTKQLREMLLDETGITGLFGFENRKAIFEGVHRSFKFVVLTFKKGGPTEEFPAAFMRHEVTELGNFPQEGALCISPALIRRISPKSLSITEFKVQEDLDIAKELQTFPLLADVEEGWGLELYGEELNMTRSAQYFHTTPTASPLYEGSMIWQFDSYYSDARYWIKESELRQLFLEKHIKRIDGLNYVPSDLKNNYEVYRLAMRRIASNTNERTLIVSVIPRNVFAGHSLGVNFPFWHTPDRYDLLRLDNSELLVLVTLLNAFVTDYVLRMRMTTNLSTFYIYQLPVPRLTESDPAFAPIVERAAKLICTMPEFDDLARAVGLGDHTHGVTDPVARAQLRAELDGIIAHIYGLTEAEFAHILSTFPLVEEQVKQDTLEAYRTFDPDPELMALIRGGETETVEFKIGARRSPHTGKKDDKMPRSVVKAVAAFMNAKGGTLLIGVADDGTITGINAEYPIANPGKRNWDGYALYLADVLNNSLQVDAPFQHYTLTRHNIKGQDVCRVAVCPAPAPVYVDRHFFARTGIQSRELHGPDLVEYVAGRWG